MGATASSNGARAVEEIVRVRDAYERAEEAGEFSPVAPHAAADSWEQTHLIWNQDGCLGGWRPQMATDSCPPAVAIRRANTSQ